MKKLILSLCLLSTIALAGIFEDSFKIYSQDADTIFMSALSAISSSNQYEIAEMQTKNGYILFLHGSRYYLLTVTRRYQNQSEVKIMPQNSDFSQGSGVAREVFALINAKLLTQPMEQIK
ncbi:MAG: hypothetical protein IKU37_06870 [Candidatus Gastranaerophilales bacterium]|nr:hypothetical protein [Candidatus Gastranaerophilales bacterium]